jgi:hypothetical protein
VSDDERRPNATSPCPRCLETGAHTWVEGDCVLRHNYSGHRHPPRAVHGNACPHCIERQKSWLLEIVELFATLAEVLLPGSIPDTTAEHKRPKKGAEAPVPVRLGALAMLYDRARLNRTGDHSDLPDVPGVLTDLAQRISDDLGVAGAYLDGTLARAAHILTVRAEDIGSSAWIDEYDAELAWVRSALRREHGLSDLPKQPVGRCPSLDGDGQQCAGPLWPDRHGAMAVECGRCRRRFDEQFLRHLGGMIAAS